jgi:hypothetical protein
VGAKLGDGLERIHYSIMRGAYYKTRSGRLTPCSIMAILSALRAVDSRWVMKITDLVLCPVGPRDIASTVSNTWF